jgi:hypothetical protein
VNSFSRLCGNQILFTEVQKYGFAEIQIGGDRLAVETAATQTKSTCVDSILGREIQLQRELAGNSAAI